MTTKLTLNLSKSIIEVAKNYAKENSISLSKLIENYLHSITKPSSTEIEISPLVKSLTGVIPNHNDDLRLDYLNYLTEKYS